MLDSILQPLLATDDLAEKAAIIAESVFEELERFSEETAHIARQCVLLHWFGLSTIEALLQDNALTQKKSREIYEQIISLPFIESLDWGKAFHNLTRKGLLERYTASQQGLLIDTAKIMAPVYLADGEYGMGAAEAFFCYMIANQSEAAMKLLNSLFEEAIHQEDWSYISGLMHLQEEAEQLSFVQSLPLTEDLWIIRGLAHRVQGEPEAAIVDYSHALARKPFNSRIYMLLGATYTEQERYKEALDAFGHALELEPTLIQAYLNQGIVYLRQHQYQMAAKSFSQAIQIEPVNIEAYEYYIRALASFSHAATTSDNPSEHQTFSQFAIEAAPLLQQALASREKIEKTLDTEYLEIANNLSTLAALYGDQGHYKDAELLLQQALSIHEKISEPHALELVTTLTGLARIYKVEDKHDEAKQLYQRALAIQEHALGPQHLEVAVTLNNLASSYQAQGDFTNAEQLYWRALVIQEHALGPQNPEIAPILNNLATIYQAQSDFTNAEQLYRHALAIQEHAFGPQHLEVTATLNNLANLCSIRGNFAESDQLFQRALAICERELGSTHPITEWIRMNYLVAQLARGSNS